MKLYRRVRTTRWDTRPLCTRVARIRLCLVRKHLDLTRSEIAVAAAVVAVFGLLISGRDMGIVVWVPITATLTAEAVLASLLAFMPGPPGWSRTRRGVGGAVGAILLLLTPLLLYLGTAYPGCACSGAPPVPLIAGIGDYSLVVVSCYGAPALIVLAALIPSRFARAGRRRAPGALNEDSLGPPSPTPG